MQDLLTRIKTAADTIAGGNSPVKIKIMKHQFYVFDMGFPEQPYNPALQRRLWTALYFSYYTLIKTQNTTDGRYRLQDFVELVDCACRFDPYWGYDQTDIAANSRTTFTEKYVPRGVHMGSIGAFQYADALLSDFIMDTRFD